jgi:predicted O-methyltransferase YrrM
LSFVTIREDLEEALTEAWEEASKVPGFLLEPEGRFLGLVAASLNVDGGIVEVGSFKGKSTVMLAKICQRYGLPRIAAIDPHNFNNAELKKRKTSLDSTTYDEFLANLRSTGVLGWVEPYRAYSYDVSRSWKDPIRLLWIDGDHSYRGAKGDFDAFLPHVVPGGVVAFHDALHEFSGPIRVFVEDVLRSDHFGAAGFVGSIAWSQFRPRDGDLFRKERLELDKLASPVVDILKNEAELRGVAKLKFKLRRAKVPRSPIRPQEWASLINRISG